LYDRRAPLRRHHAARDACLVAVDGSRHAEAAVNLVDQLAWPPATRFSLVSVVPQAASRAEASSVRAYLADIARSVSHTNRQVDHRVLTGRPASVIIDEAERSGADVIALGNRGRGRMRSMLLGSVSTEVVERAESPVLIGRHSQASRVVFPADDSDAAVQAERVLTTWPMFDRLPIEVVRVVDIPRPWLPGVTPLAYRDVMATYQRNVAEERARLQSMANAAAMRLEGSGPAHYGDSESRRDCRGGSRCSKSQRSGSGRPRFSPRLRCVAAWRHCQERHQRSPALGPRRAPVPVKRRGSPKRARLGHPNR
jgi:nucleotide-binding universal stress UspA family protein